MEALGCGPWTTSSKALAQGYADEELVASGPNDLSGACAPGAQSAFERGPYSGLVQEWGSCGEAGGGYITLAAAPQGRECVVLLQVGMASQEGAEAGQHALDTFGVDCGPLAPEKAPAATYAYGAETTAQETTQEKRAAPRQYASETEPEPGPEADPCYDGVLTPEDADCPTKAGPPNDHDKANTPTCEEGLGPVACNVPVYPETGTACPPGTMPGGDACMPDPSAAPEEQQYGLERFRKGLDETRGRYGVEPEVKEQGETAPLQPEQPEQYEEPQTQTPGPVNPYPSTPPPSPPDSSSTDYPPFPGDPYGDATCDEVGGGPYSVPPGSPRDGDGDGIACE